MGRTKKMGITGRFGTRYGTKVRHRIQTIEGAKHSCPDCFKKLKRKSKGIWVCSKCGLKFAGKAYKPR